MTLDWLGSDLSRGGGGGEGATAAAAAAAVTTTTSRGNFFVWQLCLRGQFYACGRHQIDSNYFISGFLDVQFSGSVCIGIAFPSEWQKIR